MIVSHLKHNLNKTITQILMLKAMQSVNIDSKTNIKSYF